MRIILRILGYLRPYSLRVVVAYVALVLSIGAQLAVPRLVGYVIDDGLVMARPSILLLGSIVIIGAGIFQGVFTFYRSYLFQYLAERVCYDIRNELYLKLQRLHFAFFDRAHTGQLMSRGTEDINAIRRFLMFSLRMLVQSLGILIIVSIILIMTNWQLALLGLSVMPVLAATAIQFGRNIRPKFLAVQQQFGAMTDTLQENLAGTRVVRAFAREEAEQVKFDYELQRLYDRYLDTIRMSAFYFPLMMFLSSAGIGVVLWFGGRQVVAGNLSIGQLSAFYLYLAMLAQPVRMLGWVVNSIARGIASGERIFEVIDTVPQIRNPDAPVDLPDMKGRVEFRNVSFSYPTADELALSEVSFVAEPGQRIAMIGSTGSGKSSITALVPRFYDRTDGVIEIDGVDVRDLSLEKLRAQVGMVLQDTFLFSVSLRENISYGRPGATDEQIIAAAKAARAHDFIMELPEGYDTVIGERGVSLSGGQKQRIAIARALVMDPRILILDDATSSVDTETEFQIQEALQEVMRGRTTFVIAHRLLTLKGADLILVLEGGRIVERGDHETLLRQGGAYARIYDIQLKDQEEFASAAD